MRLPYCPDAHSFTSPTHSLLAEDRRLTEKEEAAEVGVQTASRETVSAVWRLTDGPGDAASYPPSRTAAGRLDFVLQVRPLSVLNPIWWTGVAQSRRQICSALSFNLS